MTKINMFIVLLTVITVLFLAAAPALAAGLGISPPRVSAEVPADGSTTIDFTVYYFKGEVRLEMVDIPLRVTPETLQVDASGDPVPVQITVYGDESLGSRIYDGYVRFTGVSGGMVNVAIKVKATITNLVAGEEPVPASPVQDEVGTVAGLDTGAPADGNESEETLSPSATETSNDGGDDGLSTTNLVIIIAAGLVFIGLISVAIGLVVRRRP